MQNEKGQIDLFRFLHVAMFSEYAPNTFPRFLTGIRDDLNENEKNETDGGLVSSAVQIEAFAQKSDMGLFEFFDFIRHRLSVQRRWAERARCFSLHVQRPSRSSCI